MSLAKDDFTTYTESDTEGIVDVTADAITVTVATMQSNSYVEKTNDPSLIGDFIFNVKTKCVTIDAPDPTYGSTLLGVCCLTTSATNYKDANAGGGATRDGLQFYWRSAGAGADSPRFAIRDNVSAQFAQHTGNLTVDTWYWITCIRRGSIAKALIYSDVDRTTLIKSIQLECNNRRRYKRFFSVYLMNVSDGTCTGTYIVSDYYLKFITGKQYLYPTLDMGGHPAGEK